jgi:hypothetical protein
MQRVIDTVAGTDLALGVMAFNAQGAREWRERGARYITIGLESLLAPAMRGYLKSVRE